MKLKQITARKLITFCVVAKTTLLLCIHAVYTHAQGNCPEDYSLISTIMTQANDRGDSETAAALQRCTAVGGYNAEAPTPYQNGLIGIAVRQYENQTDENGCPLFAKTLSRRISEARRFNDYDLLNALTKCADSQSSALSSFEKLLLSDAERTLEKRKKKERDDAAKEREQRQLSAAQAREEAAEKRRRADAKLNEIAEESRAKNVFAPTADYLKFRHLENGAFETSTLRATTAEIQLTNDLLMLIIQQNDQILRSMEEAKSNK